MSRDCGLGTGRTGRQRFLPTGVNQMTEVQLSLGPGTSSAPRSRHPRSAPALRYPDYLLCCSGRFWFPRSPASFLGSVPSYFISISEPEFTSSVADGTIYF